MCQCYSLINKNADLTNAKLVSEEYEKRIKNNKCPVALCKPCGRTPEQKEVKCINKKCVAEYYP